MSISREAIAASMPAFLTRSIAAGSRQIERRCDDTQMRRALIVGMDLAARDILIAEVCALLRTFGPVRRLALAIPILGTALAVAWPFARYASQERAHGTAVAFLREVSAAQRAFREQPGQRGYATDIGSLVSPCPGGSAVLSSDHVEAVAAVGYRFQLRPTAMAVPTPPDCHGRPTASDYYLALEPTDPDAAPQRAYAMTADGKAFVFFDGVPPVEADMTSEGLALAQDRLATFRIP
jgi:hypothetical protein